MLSLEQLHYHNKVLQVYFLLEIDVDSQNCRTQYNPLSMSVTSEQFQAPLRGSVLTLYNLHDLTMKRLPMRHHFLIQILTPGCFSALVNALQVSCATWSVLNISGD
jgi:hypothetical protein